MANNIKVAVKVRPLIQREIDKKMEEQWKVTGNSIQSLNVHSANSFTFDHIFGQESHNSDVYATIADPIVGMCLNGFNGTIFAYGQTSSGKTHTMMGNPTDPGIMIMAIRRIFEGNNESSGREFMIRVGYIEIYNEKVFDLLNNRKVLSVLQNGDTDVQLYNKEVVVKDEKNVIGILEQGNKIRKAELTKMNQLSSRSHAIFRIIIESQDPTNKSGAVQSSFLNLVDLAGSERADDAGTSGSRLKEGGHINKSLLFLSQAIKALSEGEKYINYRNSNLTRILQASLGGNANTAIVCNITPAAVEETSSTLSFASQAKEVKNVAICNQIYSDEAMMYKMQEEIDSLKAQLECKELIDRQKLEAEIANMQSTFLTLTRPKTNRRQTWHHMPSFDFTTLTPVMEVPENSPQLYLQTPKILKPTKVSFSPTPDRNDLVKRLDQAEEEYTELRQFTMLEKRYGCTKETDIIKNLEQQLKVAKEELQKKSNDLSLAQQKLIDELVCSHCMEMRTESNSNGMNGLTETNSNGIEVDDNKAAVELQLKELEALKNDNTRLANQLQQLQLAHENEKHQLQQQIKTTQSAQQKAEILQAEGEITLSQYKSQTTRRIHELISQVEELKRQQNNKPSQNVDLNISKIPIKVDTTNGALEMAELKYDLDQLKLTDEDNKQIIRDLESKLEFILEEKNALQSEHSEMSTQIMDFIEEVESLKSNLAKVETEREEINQKYLVDCKELEELRNSLELLTKEKESVSSLKDENLGLKEENLQLKGQITASAQEIEMLTTKLGEIEVEREAINQRNLVDVKGLEELRKTTEGNTELLTKQMESLACLDNENVELKTQLSEIKIAKEQVEIECTKYEAKLFDLITEVTHLKEQNDFLDKKLAVFEPFKAKNDILCSSVDKLEAENVKLVQQLGEMTSKYDSLGESMEATKSDLISKIESMKRNEQSFQATLNDADNELKDMAARYASAKEKILELENEVQALKLKMAEELETDVEATNYAVLEDKYATLESRHADLQKEYEASCADVEKLESINEEQLQVIEKTEQECTNIKASLLESFDKIKFSMDVTEALKLKNSLLNEEVSNLKNLLDTQSGELDNMSTQLEVLRQQNSARTECDANSKDELENLKEKHRSEIVGMENELKKVTKESQAEIVKLKTDLQEKEQLAKDTSDGLRREIKELKSALRDMEKQFASVQAEFSQAKTNSLEMKGHSIFLTDKISELKAEVRDNEIALSTLKSQWEVKEKMSERKSKELTDEIDKLKALSCEKDKQLADNVHQLDKLKAELTDKNEEKVGLENKISKMSKKLREMEHDISGWKAEITRLEKQLRQTDTKRRDSDDTKISPKKDLKGTAEIERKSRRYSQHDEARLSLNETVAAPKNVSIQTDPSSTSCGCVTMDSKIQDLTTTVRMKEATIHTLKLEMRNHPLIGENQDLKRKLHDTQMELHVQKMNTDHYKVKFAQANQAVQGPTARESVDVGVQVDLIKPSTSTVPIGQNAGLLGPLNYYYINTLPEKYQQAKLKILRLEKALKAKDLKNGLQPLTNGHPHSSSSNGHQSSTSGQSQESSSNGHGGSKKMTKENGIQVNTLAKLVEKTDLYRNLAVSRREDIKRLEALVESLRSEQAPQPTQAE